MSFVSKRVNSLPPYLFSVIHEKKKRLMARGVDVIDLGIGAPDLPAPDFIVDRMAAEMRKPQNHRYSPYEGVHEYREAVARFYKRQYGVELDPDHEVLLLIGSKEGIAQLISAVADPGDAVLIPDPGYPVYRAAVHLAGGESIYFPLDPDNDYVPLYHLIPEASLERAKLMLLNYPGNPTGGTVDLDTFSEASALAKKHRFALAHDSAYGLVTFDGYEAPSILQVPGAKEVAVELGSLSKSFNMTGWRIGYAVGNREMIKALSVVKSNTDTGQFIPIQLAAAEALDSDYSSVKANNQIYRERMEVMLSALQELGIKVKKPRGTFFIWAPVPKGATSAGFAEQVLEKAGVIVTPGSAFGPSGEGYFRISLSVDTTRLADAAERLKNLKMEEARG
ncbi:MAG TPA: LL-diaminopimelate aminotransferase [Bacillaceae bacterium]